MLLDGFRLLVMGAMAGTMLATIVATARTSLSGRVIFGAIAGMWIALAVVVTPSGSPLILPLMFGTPLVAATIFALTVPSFRTALSGIPTTYLIRLNAFRVMGVFMLLAIADGRLGGPFPYFAGIGDIITGLFALSTASLFERNPRDPRVLFWNAFGMLDLVVAVTLGLLSNPNVPFQLIHAGVGSAAIGTLPWSLIPFVFVPTYLIGHATIFSRLLGRQENAVTT